ncbi:hypothetical protein [Microvirga mediterraneensis]|uniref:Uncharacterized protein n=1 Tax=Microvirga mediterraneensis TaxID=2754695 RepID=A0A838BP09_9HYPH|nr:hypothetical protein [Microvirga mediterraneensis]MBA1156799.1 hypothetical protein [Microvirga mediterraneensis]
MARQTILFGSAFLCLVVHPALAGPCTPEIDRAQAQVDTRLDAMAGAGPTGTESKAALLRRQPTPASIAAAEQKLGEGKPEEAALAALARARAADASGDKGGCDEALTLVRKALAQ